MPVVLGPSRDGGYWLVAQRTPGVDVFAGAPWSSPDTLSMTRRRLEAMCVPHAELAVRGDLDTLADLELSRGADGLDRGLNRRLTRALHVEPHGED